MTQAKTRGEILRIEFAGRALNSIAKTDTVGVGFAAMPPTSQESADLRAVVRRAAAIDLVITIVFFHYEAVSIVLAMGLGGQ